MKSLLYILLCFSFFANAQKITISGYVKDNDTKEVLIGVNIYDSNLKKGTITNKFGFYSISYNKNDTINLIFSYIGYKIYSIKEIAKNNQEKNILLSTNNILQTVEISATKNKEETPEISTVKIPMQQIKQLPAIAGEPDVIRSFQLMPGVQSGKEGTSGIYVRGGSPDQNLFLLDDVELYYVSHIGGFLSTFDANAINDVTLYKGGFPARYGGRLSSVVDLRMKDGNKQKIKGEISIGTLATKISVEGPIKKDTSSFFLSARRCNIDIFTRPASLLDSDGDAMGGYTFYDLYGKYNHILNNKDRIFVSFYAGRDKIFVNVNDKAQSADDYSLKLKNTIKWGNLTGSVKYNHIISHKIFSNFIIAYTKYHYNTNLDIDFTNAGSNVYSNSSSASFTSGIQDINFKMNFDIFASNSHKIKTGANVIFHFYNPGKSEYSGILSSSKNDTIISAQIVKAFETNIYIEDEWKITKKLSTNIGVRFCDFIVENSSYISIQPRININYEFIKTYSVKASYTEMSQAIHLVSSSGAGLPSDIWLPATDYLKPEKSKQFALGFSHSFRAEKHKIETSVEGYYKTLDNLIEYKEGVSFFGNNQDWENKIERNGKAEIYGLEFLLQKTTGKTTGWISYTWSKNFRTFENINNGKAFPYKYDRRHDISIVIMHRFSEKFNISATWVYSTGYALTLATNKYFIINNTNDLNSEIFNEAHIYNGKNSYRMPSFHKLDIGANFIKQKPKGIRTWTIGIYNVYARQNAFYLYYKKVDNQVKLYQYSLFPFIPSVSYSFRF